MAEEFRVEYVLNGGDFKVRIGEEGEDDEERWNIIRKIS